MKRRILSMFCVLALCLSLLPATALADGGNKTIMLGTSGIKDPTPTATDKGKYYTPSSYVYFGVNGSEPIKWRVLNADTANDNSTEGVFLLSEYLLASGVYFQQSYHNEGNDLSTQSHKGSVPSDCDHTNCLIANAWQGSDAQAWCKTFASSSSNFSAAEQSAMLGIVKTDSVENNIYHLDWGESSLTAEDKMFFLSAWELANYVGDYDYAPELKAQFVGGGVGDWWLRSPIAERSLIAGLVADDGKAYYTNVKNANAVRPAFNLDQASVLFTSAATGGKSANGMDSGLTAVDDYTGNEWKLTLLDESRNFAISDATINGSGDTIDFSYTGAQTGTNEYISVIIVKNDAITHYGRVLQLGDTAGGATGTVTLTLPADVTLDNDTYLYVFNEHYDNTKAADYASQLIKVDIKSLSDADVKVSGSYTYDGTAKQPSGDAVTVTLDGKTLTENTDYTLSYSTNTDAGTATVTATGQGKYTGTAIGHFTINKATPTVTNVQVSGTGTIYDTTDISTIVLTHADGDTPGTVALDEDQELTVGENSYRWTFTPTDDSNYTTTTGIIELSVQEDTLTGIEVTKAPDKTEYTYGDSFDPTGMVVTATYASNATKDVTNEVVITPTELTVDVTALTITYGGQSVKQTITVNPKEISIENATVQDKTYDGNTDATVESVTFTGATLKDTDYTATAEFSSKDANNSQSATVKVTLSNNNYTFAGNNAEATFNTNAKISPLPVVLEWNYDGPFLYDGSQKTVTTTVTNKVGEDTFALTYNDNAKTDVGEYTAEVTGLGNANYTLDGVENTTLDWKIEGASIADATVTLSATEFTYDGSVRKPTVTVTLGDNELTEGTDYTVQFSGDSINADTYTVTVTGKGNYSGTATASYTIAKADQADLTITSQGPATYGQDYTLTTEGGSGDGAVTFTVSNGTGAATIEGSTLIPTKAGTVTVTATKAGGNNYNDKTSETKTIIIDKATYTGDTTAAGTVLANWPGEVDLPAIPDGASYGTPSSSDLTGMSIADGVLHYTGGPSIVKGQQYTVTVPVTNATNYLDYPITVTLTGTDIQVLSITGVTAQDGTYNGQKHTGYTGIPKAEGYDGGFEVTYSADPVNAGNYTVTIAIPDDCIQYTGSVTLDFTISPASVTVNALDRNISVGQKAPDLSAPVAGVDYEVSGLIGGDSLNGSVTMEYQKDGVAVTPNTYTPGDYDIAVSCADTNPNYAVTCIKGQLTITINSANLPNVHDITVAPTEHGVVTVTPNNASQGVKITVTVRPDEGYSLSSLSVTDANGNKIAVTGSGSNYTFTMPDSDVTVTAAFRAGAAACDRGAACPLRAFSDLDVYAWYHDGVHYCLANGLMNGVADTLFAPNASLTRAMLVTILWRVEGKPVVNYYMPFTDVDGGAWYAEAVRWAASEGIVNGVTDTSFAPDDPITREQLAAILWRYAKAKGYDVSIGEETNILSYEDFAQISEYAIPAMQWACGAGIINGVTESTLVPQGTATRAQAATMLMRFCEG